MVQKSLTFCFTKKALLRLNSPQKLTTYHDTKVRGLKLMVRPSGTKTFILYHKISRQPERIYLGRFPDLSIERARAKASELNAQIATGKNPNATRRAIRQELTFGEFFEIYMERHAKLHKKSWEEDQGQFNRHFKQWAKKRLSNIAKNDVLEWHAKLGKESGIYAANRALELIRVAFNKAIAWGWEGTNPASGIKAFREKSRDRFLEADELPAFFAALSEEPNTTIRDYILMSLLTGARKSNILTMRWEQIHSARAVWRIPESNAMLDFFNRQAASQIVKANSRSIC